MNSHELVIYRNLFYRKIVLYQLGILFTLLAAIISCGYFIRVINRDQIKPVYFMTNNIGELLKFYPLDQSVYNDEEVESWADKKIQYLLSMNFATHQKIMNAAAEFFNPIGYIQYMAALDKSRLFYALNIHKYVAVVDVVHPLKIKKKNLVLGNTVHVWRLEGTYRVQYFNNLNSKNPFIQEMNMTVLIRREDFSLYPEGLSIMTIIA